MTDPALLAWTEETFAREMVRDCPSDESLSSDQDTLASCEVTSGAVTCPRSCQTLSMGMPFAGSMRDFNFSCYNVVLTQR
jgi:hypothetical protein